MEPSIGVVIATRNRPNLLRRAIASALAQDYPGPLRVVVVHDREEPDWGLTQRGARPVTALRNWREPGPGGARNTGILAADACDLVAILDDDDTWAPQKLTRQVAALGDARLCTCAAEVEFDGRSAPLPLGLATIETGHLLRRGVRRLRASGLLARRSALVSGGIGLFAEDAPPGGRVWDLVIRACRRGPVVHVDEPLVHELARPDRGTGHDRARLLGWIAGRYPELREHRPQGRLAAERACWQAVAGDRRGAWQSLRAAARANSLEPRTALAALAAAGLLPTTPLRAFL